MELVYKLSGLPLKARLKRQRFCSRFCENIKLIYGEMFVNAEEHCMLNFRFLALCRRCSFVGCSGVWADVEWIRYKSSRSRFLNAFKYQRQAAANPFSLASKSLQISIWLANRSDSFRVYDESVENHRLSVWQGLWRIVFSRIPAVECWNGTHFLSPNTNQNLRTNVHYKWFPISGRTKRKDFFFLDFSCFLIFLMLSKIVSDESETLLLSANGFEGAMRGLEDFGLNLLSGRHGSRGIVRISNISHIELRKDIVLLGRKSAGALFELTSD